MKKPLLVWGAVVLPLWVTMILCTHWEPVTRDGWGHVSWHLDHTVTVGSLWDVLYDGWLGSNPRFGQMLTYILYTPGPWHSLITPIVELGLFYTLTTLALGRWPSFRRVDDALAFATVFAITAICTPEFGSMLFYRPYTGNYLFGLALNALWLVPYRLQFEEPRRRTWLLAPSLLVLGLAAGNCNEHTGPAVLAAAALATAAIVRRGTPLRLWMIMGMLGLLAGYLLLIFAPGQHERYNHLAEQQGALALIASRGILGNLRILGRPLMCLAQSLPWIVIGLGLRRAEMPSLRRRGAYGAMLVALISTLLLFGSPKLGARLYLATISFSAVAIASWALCSSAHRLLGFVAGLVTAFVCIRCTMIYSQLADEGSARVVAMTTAKPGDKLLFHHFDDRHHWYDIDLLGQRRWFLGDDFAVQAQRDSLAGNWHVEVVLKPFR